MLTCQMCNSDRLFEGEISSGYTVYFFVNMPKQSFPYVDSYKSKLGAIACKDCGNIVQVKLRNLDGLKKLEGIQ